MADDWGALHEALRALQPDCRADISDTELDRVEDLIRAVAVIAFRR